MWRGFLPRFIHIFPIFSDREKWVVLQSSWPYRFTVPNRHRLHDHRHRLRSGALLLATRQYLFHFLMASAYEASHRRRSVILFRLQTLTLFPRSLNIDSLEIIKNSVTGTIDTLPGVHLPRMRPGPGQTLLHPRLTTREYTLILLPPRFTLMHSPRKILGTQTFRETALPLRSQIINLTCHTLPQIRKILNTI